jgi:KUP system potassium uptake protein
VLRHHWARTHSIDERIVLLTVMPTNDPYLRDEQRVIVEKLSPNLVRVTAYFGFMEKLDIKYIVKACAVSGLQLDAPDTTYYLADPQIVPRDMGLLHSWRRALFVFLRQNSRPVGASLGIPADSQAKLGLEVPM